MKSLLHRITAFLMISVLLVPVLGVQIDAYAAKNDKTVLTIATPRSEQDMLKYKTGFEKRHPNVQINYVYYQDYDNDINKKLADGDDVGDVLMLPSGLNSDQVTKYFLPLGDVTSLSTKYNYMDQAWQVNSQVYGMPSFAYFSGFVYNKRIFDEAGITQLPENTEEMLEDLKQIKSLTKAIPFYTNDKEGWALAEWEAFPYIEMTGDASYKYNVFPTIKNPFENTSGHKTVYNLLYEIVAQDLCEPSDSEITWDQSKGMINNGQIACMAIGSWAMPQFKTAGSNSDDIGFFTFPNEVDGRKYVTVTTDRAYAISAKTSHKKLAKSYIDYMINDSGFAADNDSLSIVKTDNYPSDLSNIENTYPMTPVPASQEYAGWFDTLAGNLTMSSGQMQKEVIDEARKKTGKTIDDILKEWDKSWEELRSDSMSATGTSNEILSVLNSNQDNKQELELSADEKKYLKQVGTIHVGYITDFAPFSYKQNGSIGGMSREILKWISEETGLKYEYKAYRSFKEMEDDLKSGAIDMIAAIDSTSNANDAIRTSKSYITSSIVIVKNQQTSASDLTDLKVAIAKDSESNLYQGIEKYKNAKNIPLSLQYVNQMKADYAITNFYTASDYISRNHLTNLEILPSSINATISLGYSNNTDARLISICNKCLYLLPAAQSNIYLTNAMNSHTENVNLLTFIRVYPIQSVIFMLIVFAIIVTVILYILRQKNKFANLYEKMSETDPLTGLYNRNGYEKSIGLMEKKPYIFAIFDIDNFKSVNDSLGHQGGDNALKSTAEIAIDYLGNKGNLARFGGDEFLIWAHADKIGDPTEFMQGLIKKMYRDFEFRGHTIKLSISLGAVVAGAGYPAENALKAADKNLYQVKENGKNNCLVTDVEEVLS